MTAMFRASSYQRFFSFHEGLTSAVAGIMISCLLVPTPTLSTTEFLQNSATQQLCPPSLPGLAAAYCFEDNVLDEVGDANGQIVGNANFVSGLLNGTKAFEFDGATYVRLASPPSWAAGLDAGKIRVVSLWFYATPGANLRLFVKQNSDGCRYSPSIQLSSGRVYFNSDGCANKGYFFISEVLGYNKWHHIVLDYLPSLQKAYIDGVLVSTTSIHVNRSYNSQARVVMGGSYADAEGGYIMKENWKGILDDVLIFTSALSETQIASLYNSYVMEAPNANQTDDPNVSPASNPNYALEWLSKVGGSGGDSGEGVAVDSEDNVLVTGHFEGTVDFNPGADTFELTSAGGQDAFVLKLDSASVFQWAVKVGGAEDDEAQSITVDSEDNVLVTGRFQGTVDFNPGADTFELTSAGGQDAFVLKLDSASVFQWAVKVGGADSDFAFGIVVDSADNIIITGYFQGTVDFNPGAGIFELTSAGGQDVFALKLNSAGVFQWAVKMGGTDQDYGYSIAVDSADNIIISGSFAGAADFNPGSGIFELTSAGILDVFVLKLDSAGAFQWAVKVGGAGYDLGYGIVADSADNIIITGSFQYRVDFNPGAGTFRLLWRGDAESQAEDEGDAFVLKLDSSGAFQWAGMIGSISGNRGRGIAVNSADNIVITGGFKATTDFNPGAGVFELTSAGFSDVFVLKLDSAGVFQSAVKVGGNESDRGHAIAVDSADNIITTGPLRGTADFDPGAGSFELTSSGSNDAFLLKVVKAEVEVTFVNQPPNTYLRATLLPQPNRDTDNSGTPGFPVVEIVLVDSQTGETVSVDDDPSNEIVFFLPGPPTPLPTTTRTQLESLGACIEGKLQRDELSCQWLDPNTNSWSSKGCILSYVGPSTNTNGASHKCTCSHLTVFTIQSRKVEVTNTFGLSGAGLYVSLAVFCLLMAAVACVFYHWRQFPESEPLAVVYLVAGWVSVGSDLLLVRYLGQAASGCGETGAFLAPFADGILAVTLYSIFVNGLLNSWFIWTMANNKIDISRWVRSHKKQVVFIWLAALPAPSILNLLGSKLFGIQKDFPAVSGQNDQRFPLLSKLSLVNMVFEDIPQLAIGIAMAVNFGAFSGLQQFIVALKFIYILTCSFKAFYTAAWCRAIAFVKVLVTSCAKASLKQLNSMRKSKKLTRLNNAELPSQALAKIDPDAPVDDADADSDVDSTGGASDNIAA